MDMQKELENSPAVKQAIAFREVTLAENPTKEQLKAAGIDPDAKRAETPEFVASKLVFTNDTKELPEGSSARKVTDGVFEVFHTADTTGVVKQPAGEPVRPLPEANTAPNVTRFDNPVDKPVVKPVEVKPNP